MLPTPSVGYSDLKTHSTIHPNPANTARSNRSRASTPNRSCVVCSPTLGSSSSTLCIAHSPSCRALLDQRLGSVGGDEIRSDRASIIACFASPRARRLPKVGLNRSQNLWKRRHGKTVPSFALRRRMIQFATCPMTLRRPAITFEGPTPRTTNKSRSSASAWELPVRRLPSCEWVAIGT